MNILFVVGTFPTYSETFITNQINDLIERGHKVILFSFNKGDAVIEHSYANRHGLVGSCLYQNAPKSFFKRICNKIHRIVRGQKYTLLDELLEIEQNIDIVHCHFGDIALLFDEMYFDKYFKRAKKICTFHGYDFLPDQPAYYKLLYKRLIQRFDAVTYNTPYFGTIIKEVFPASKCYELPVGFNEDFLEPFYNEKIKKSNRNGKFNIIFCGRIIELKGVFLLPEIAKRLIQKKITNFVFSIIGEGDDRGKLQCQIENLNLKDSFRFYGALPQEEVFEKMTKGDVFIMPGVEDPQTGRAETQGLVLQEAQYLGLPVIVSDIGGMRFGMIDNQTGFVIEAHNIDVFVDKVIYLMHLRKGELDRISNLAHEFAKENYTSKKLGNVLYDIYKKTYVS